LEKLTPEQMEKVTAVIETNQGTIKFKFFPNDAPGHSLNFIKLATDGFYNGLVFHRVIKGFMVQGGCPDGTGTGGPGYNIKAEFNKNAHIDGTVSMARSQDPDSAGSQFFICLGRQDFLDNQYTAFGQVIEGLDVVHTIGATKTNTGDKPVEDMIMEKVYIEGL
jgi:peptidyl-prolyl cis-trans isomerase B (cyclophilin B)